MNRSALVLGATGLVGGHVLRGLLADPAYAAVTTLGRRPLDRTHAKQTHHVIDFDEPAQYAPLVRADDVFCCLGTTMRQAGSKDAFRRVDYSYVVDAAKNASANGAEQFLLVSALGADAGSMVFYNRVKGEAEEAVRTLPFYGVYLARPSLLRGDRAEARAGEQRADAVLNAVSFLLRGPLRRFRPIEAATVAHALIALAKQRPGGVQVYGPEALRGAAHPEGERRTRGN